MPARRLIALAAPVLGVAALAVVPSSAVADPQSTAAAGLGSGTRTFSFVNERLEEGLDLRDPQAPALGDRYFYTNRTEGDLGPGTEYAECTFHQLADGDPEYVLACTVTVHLPGGSITSQGAARFSTAAPGPVGGSGEFAITGGTGHFRGVTGQVVFRPVETEEGEPLRYQGEILLTW